jgi:hypothetical protein
MRFAFNHGINDLGVQQHIQVRLLGAPLIVKKSQALRLMHQHIDLAHAQRAVCDALGEQFAFKLGRDAWIRDLGAASGVGGSSYRPQNECTSEAVPAPPKKP